MLKEPLHNKGLIAELRSDSGVSMQDNDVKYYVSGRDSKYYYAVYNGWLYSTTAGYVDIVRTLGMSIWVKIGKHPGIEVSQGFKPVTYKLLKLNGIPLLDAVKV